MSSERDQVLAEAFVGLADTLVGEYDVIDLSYRLAETCVQLLAADAAGLLLADLRGELELLAASNESARLVELFQLQAREGPCLDCFRHGSPVTCTDLSDAGERWPKFAAQALRAGFGSVHALPMRLRSETIGALNLFCTLPGPLPATDLRLGQALADVATVSILQERAIRRSEVLAEQLQAALNSRVVIEQAKGKLAGRGHLDMEQAFIRLRNYARSQSQLLSELAYLVVTDSVDLRAVLQQASDPVRPA